MIVFLVVGIIVSFANPLLGAVVILPWAVAWVAKAAGWRDGWGFRGLERLLGPFLGL